MKEVHFILDNIYNEDISNGIFFRYRNLIAKLLEKGHDVTLITRYIEGVTYPKRLCVRYIAFINMPLYNELYLPLSLGAEHIDFSKGPTLFTLLEYCNLFFWMIPFRKLYDFKLILGYHTDLKLYTESNLFLTAVYDVGFYVKEFVAEDLLLVSGHSTLDYVNGCSSCEKVVWYELSPRFLEVEPIYPTYDKSAPINLIYLGRISQWQKNVFELKEIRERLQKTQQHQVFLTVYGNGPDLDEFKRLCADDELITFKGNVPQDSIYDEYRNYVNPIFIYPSTTETLGKSAIEASIIGLPVFARESPETSFLYETGTNGYIYYTPKECCSQINRFLNMSADSKRTIIRNGHDLRNKFEKDIYDTISQYLT